MKKNLFYTVLSGVMMMVLTTACTNDNDLVPADGGSRDSETTVSEKTVLIYMAGRNNLSDIIPSDLNEIKEGSRKISDKHNLLVFVRNNHGDGMPWLARIKNGQVTDSVSLSDMGIRSSDGQNRASDPAIMEGVMSYAFSHYRAASNNYGLVLWGHGSGWLIMDEVERTSSRAYGVDYGDDYQPGDGRWINLPEMAKILKNQPHLKFIMGDCCNLMCLENLYELRDVCDYIIGSPAEIPGQGAPYQDIVPDFFAEGNFYTHIIDKYYKSLNGNQPLTAVKTSEMTNVAQATREAMRSVRENIGQGYADMRGMIHYYYTDKRDTFYPEYNIFYDAGDFLLKYASREAYSQWRQVLERAVVERRMATRWETDKSWKLMYSDFTVTEEKFHGVSMFVPQDPATGNYARYNENVKQLAWWNAVNE